MRTLIYSALIAVAGQAATAQACQILEQATVCNIAKTIQPGFWTGTWEAVAGPQRVSMSGAVNYGNPENLGSAGITMRGDRLFLSVDGKVIDGQSNGFSGRIGAVDGASRMLFWDGNLARGLNTTSLENAGLLQGCDVADLPQWSATVLSDDGLEMTFDMVAVHFDQIWGNLVYDGVVSGTAILVERRVNITRDSWDTAQTTDIWEDSEAERCAAICADEPERCKGWGG